MTILDERPEGEGAEEENAPNLAASETRAAGRWNAVGVPTERSAKFGESVRRLATRLRPDRWVLVPVVDIPVVSAGLNVYGPRIPGEATDTIIAGLFHPGDRKSVVEGQRVSVEL